MTCCYENSFWLMPVTDILSDGLSKKATREGYGDALVAMGEQYSKLVVLDADLSGSTKTKPFAKKYPDRFFNFGVAEQNLVGQAAGFALSGMLPVASSFAIFLTGRAWEIVRNSVAYPGLNVKLAATHAGITLGEDGASHQIVEDISIMRTIPRMTVLVPADYWQAYRALEASLSYEGPVYLRLGRPAIPVFYEEQDDFVIGKGRILKEGKEVAFIACGVMVLEAWKAAIKLKSEGINATVVDMSTIKPLDSGLLEQLSEDHNLFVTFEEHNVIGGLGSAVAEFSSSLKKPIQVNRIGIEDTFGQSGSINNLMKHYGLASDELIPKLKKLIK
jgi:transketolase